MSAKPGRRVVAGWLLAVGVLLPLNAGAWIPVCRAAEPQWQPDIAFDGTRFLVVWTDHRDVRTDSSTNIYACRVGRDGAVLDPAGIRIAGGLPNKIEPQVAAGDSGWVVIWQDGC